MFLSSALGAAEISPEPCINGAVSMTGLYASQELEDAAQQASIAKTWVLEPCMNGGVSASGLYASQSEEDASRDIIANATAG